MSSQLFPNARQLFATAQLDWTSGNWKAVILSSAYVFNGAQQYLSDLPSAQILATAAIANRTAALGFCTGDTISFGTIASGLQAGYIVFYKDTGVATTSPLVVFFDEAQIPGMPQVLNGYSYFFYKNVSAGGWFRI